MDYQDYLDFGYKIKGRLCEDLNGTIRFLVHDKEDAMSIDISWHDFKYRAIITNLSSKVFAFNSVEDICNSILEEYKEKLLNVYFKSDVKKRREKERESYV